MKSAPCMGCSDRYSACHSSCKKYIAWRKEMDRVKENRQEYYRYLDKHAIYY